MPPEKLGVHSHGEHLDALDALAPRWRPLGLGFHLGFRRDTAHAYGLVHGREERDDLLEGHVGSVKRGEHLFVHVDEEVADLAPLLQPRTDLCYRSRD